MFGPRGHSKVRFLLEMYCDFAKITLFIPRGAPRVILYYFLLMLGHVLSIPCAAHVPPRCKGGLRTLVRRTSFLQQFKRKPEEKPESEKSPNI